MSLLSKSDNDSTFKDAFFRNSSLVLLFLLISRLIAMYFVPLNDSTEARYGEIARIMLETGNWVTPMHNYGVPFWAKPPLSTWLSAISMQGFGVNELAVRLPGLLLSLGVLWFVWITAKVRSGSMVAMTSVLVLASSLYFYLDAGTVMTDPALLFCTTLSLMAFWHALVYRGKLWGYLFFVGLGLGLLAKGPIALVLTGMPIFFWVVWQKKWVALWHNLPWITGGLVMFVIALPWYGLAESRTPGFINYFIVGEHIKRFLQPGWTGDKYGFAHVAPYGMIWVYALIGISPWSIVGITWLVRHAKEVRSIAKDEDGWLRYLMLCTLIPLLFFTFARNIIYPYVFPSLPTFALIFAELTHRACVPKHIVRRFIPLATISGVIFLLVTGLFVFKPELVAKSQDRVVRAYNNQNPGSGSHLIYWSHKTDYSAQFYSAGHAEATIDSDVFCRLVSDQGVHYVVIDSEGSTPFPTALQRHVTNVATIPILKKQYSLLRVEPFHCTVMAH